jgi:hypothetical protein
VIIRDAIERAGNDQEIFFLLTAYVETVRYGDQLNLLPWQVRDLPLAGSDDLKARIYGLQVRRTVSDVDHDIRLVVEETIDVFRTALRRLTVLQADHGPTYVAWEGDEDGR